jgi:hypothetical protein
VTQVVLFTHDEIRCALPAAQVVGATLNEEAPAIQLWSRTKREDADVRALLVETRLGRRRVSSSETRFSELDEATMAPLPELLTTSMALPHVVGVASSAGAIVWLVDLAKWEER